MDSLERATSTAKFWNGIVSRKPIAGCPTCAANLIKIRATGLVERIDRTRHYRVIALDVKHGVVLVKARAYLRGLPRILASEPSIRRSKRNLSDVEAAVRLMDTALYHFCQVLSSTLCDENSR